MKTDNLFLLVYTFSSGVCVCVRVCEQRMKINEVETNVLLFLLF